MNDQEIIGDVIKLFSISEKEHKFSLYEENDVIIENGNSGERRIFINCEGPILPIVEKLIDGEISFCFSEGMIDYMGIIENILNYLNVGFYRIELNLKENGFVHTYTVRSIFELFNSILYDQIHNNESYIIKNMKLMWSTFELVFSPDLPDSITVSRIKELESSNG